MNFDRGETRGWETRTKETETELLEKVQKLDRGVTGVVRGEGLEGCSPT